MVLDRMALIEEAEIGSGNPDRQKMANLLHLELMRVKASLASARQSSNEAEHTRSATPGWPDIPD